MSRPDLRTRCGLLLLLSVAGSAAADPEVGRSLEPWRVVTLAQRGLSPESLRGRVLVLNFWATWCAPCRQEMPALEAFHRKYAGQGVEVVAVSVDDRADLPAVRRVMEAYSFTAALAVDSDLRSFGRVRQVPATFVIDRAGVLRRDGWREAGIVDLEGLEKAVRPLLDARSGG